MVDYLDAMSNCTRCNLSAFAIMNERTSSKRLISLASVIFLIVFLRITARPKAILEPASGAIDRDRLDSMKESPSICAE
jgi:hypothetical protein